MQTLVINNREALVMTRAPSSVKDEKGRSVNGETVIFRPGLNIISTADLKRLRENKAFDSQFTSVIKKAYVEEQNPEKVGHPILKVARELTEKQGLKDIPPQEAVSLIKEIFDTAILDRWLVEDARDNVRIALLEQRKLLDAGAGPVGSQVV